MSAADDGRLRLCLPSVFVKPPIAPPAPPPFPGTVTAEDLRPPADPPLPFLVPWAAFRKHPIQLEYHKVRNLPCDIDVVALEKHTERHEVRSTVECVFKSHADRDTIVDEVMASLSNPFCANARKPSVVWTLHHAIRKNPTMSSTLGGKKLAHRHRILQGPAWSIVSYGEPAADSIAFPAVVRRNVIYDGDGKAVAQVDFGHGSHCGIHCHALVEGNLEHTPGSSEDHMFPLQSIPWMWTCVPDVRSPRLALAWRSCGRLPVSDDDEDAGADGVAATSTIRLSADDVALSALREKKGGARLFGLCDTAALDGGSVWCDVNVPFEDYSTGDIDDE